MPYTHSPMKGVSGLTLCGLPGANYTVTADEQAVTCSFCKAELMLLQMIAAQQARAAQPSFYLPTTPATPSKALQNGYYVVTKHPVVNGTFSTVVAKAPDTRYPHKCPRCGGAAYLTGNNLVEHPTGKYEC